MLPNAVIRCVVLLSVASCQSANPPGVTVTKSNDHQYVVNRAPAPPQPSKADLLAHKPPHLPAHAHLWESDQDGDFVQYGWVAYDGPVGPAPHNVHHLRVYHEDGSAYFQGFYVGVPAGVPLVVDYANYRVDQPQGKVVALVTGGVRHALLGFNYNDREYAPMFRPGPRVGPRPQLVTAYTVATGSPEADVYVVLAPRPDGAQVTVEDECHDVHTGTYAWQPLTAVPGPQPVPPFRFKYYDPSAHVLYLVDPNWALIQRPPGRKE